MHALAHLLGFQLLPRIRNWRDRTFYRPAADSRYLHIDSLFGDPTSDVIDWDLIETHWPDLIRVALSIRQGTLSSTLLLRRLRADSHRNRIYQAFRELGRVIRTITLLRYISEPNLRRQITAATNKAESYNAFSTWLRFAGDVLARNDPAEQENSSSSTRSSRTASPSTTPSTSPSCSATYAPTASTSDQKTSPTSRPT